MLFKYLQLPLERARVSGRAERAEIMMIADPLDLHMLPIEEKPLSRVNSMVRLRRGFHRCPTPWPPARDRRDRLVKHGRLERPEPRVRHGDLLVEVLMPFAPIAFRLSALSRAEPTVLPSGSRRIVVSSTCPPRARRHFDQWSAPAPGALAA